MDAETSETVKALRRYDRRLFVMSVLLLLVNNTWPPKDEVERAITFVEYIFEQVDKRTRGHV
jgi:hypothetical protein